MAVTLATILVPIDAEWNPKATIGLMQAVLNRYGGAFASPQQSKVSFEIHASHQEIIWQIYYYADDLDGLERLVNTYFPQAQVVRGIMYMPHLPCYAKTATVCRPNNTTSFVPVYADSTQIKPQYEPLNYVVQAMNNLVPQQD